MTSDHAVGEDTADPKGYLQARVWYGVAAFGHGPAEHVKRDDRRPCWWRCLRVVVDRKMGKRQRQR